MNSRGANNRRDASDSRVGFIIVSSEHSKPANGTDTSALDMVTHSILFLTELSPTECAGLNRNGFSFIVAQMAIIHFSQPYKAVCLDMLRSCRF